MKKMLKKVSKITLIVMLLLTLDLSLVLNCVQAADATKLNVYQIDYCEKVLSYKGFARGSAYVVYKQNGVEYPAYCIDPLKVGVGETDSYDVTIQGVLKDAMLWRIITNGYPYKTLEELGVQTQKEAYLATKQAMYCYLDNRDINQYIALGTSGIRTLNAMKQIWNNAHNSTETKVSNIVEVSSKNSEWNQDSLSKRHISKTYKIKAPAPITDFTIEIKGENLPMGLVVTDINNNIKTTFKENEEFKVLIPINKLKNNGAFEINVTTQMKTKPVLYGAAPSDNVQDYAITTFSYEDSTGTYYEEFQKNETQIKVLKREKTTNTPLKGVEFQLLNSAKIPIVQNLVTDEKGEITIKDMEPGTYYLKEIRTLPGYVPYDENIKIDINLNEKINVIVNNSKEKKIEISKETTSIEVGKTEENIKQEMDETNINQETNNIEINQETSKTNTNQETNNININQEMSQTNTNQETNNIDINQEMNETNTNKETNNIDINQEMNETNTNQETNNIDINQEMNEINTNQETNNININQEMSQTNTKQETNNININQEMSQTNTNQETNKINVKQELNNTNITVETTQEQVEKLPKTGM